MARDRAAYREQQSRRRRWRGTWMTFLLAALTACPIVPLPAGASPPESERAEDGRATASDRPGERLAQAGSPPSQPSSAESSGTAPSPPIQLPGVTVPGLLEQSYNPNTSTAGSKVDLPSKDVPQSIQVVPRQVIEDQRALSLTDVLRNVSGFAPSINSQSQRFGDRNVIFRGFTTNNYYTNGFKDSFNGSSFSFGLSNVERIEVLKGPASVLYGLGEPGATINVVTKQPLPEWYVAGSLTAGSYGFVEPSIDISGPLLTNPGVRFRLNGAYQQTDSFVDFVESQRFLIAPVVTIVFSPDTVLTLEGEYQEIGELYYTGLPAVGTILPNINGSIPRSRYLGDPDLEDKFPERTLGKAGYRLDHRFNENVSLRHGFRASLFTVDERDVIPIELDVDERTMFRELFVSEGDRQDYYFLTEVTARFRTGPLAHVLLVGSDQRILRSYASFASAEIDPLDVFTPTYGGLTDPIDATTPRTVTDQSGLFLGVYVQDLITIVDQLKLMVGGRLDYATQETDSRNTGTGVTRHTEFDDVVFTPRAGLVYQPIPAVSLYASYATSINPIAGTKFDGSAFEPERGVQYEGGVKLDLFGGRITSTVAIYQLTRENVLTPDPDNPGFSIQNGEQRSRGVEVDIAGEILPGLKVIGAYAYTDAEITKSTSGTAGNQPANVPEHTGSVWGVYEFRDGPLRGLGFGLGIVAVSRRPADNENTVFLPSYVRTDAAIYFRRWKNVELALNFKNIFDTEYFETSTFADPFTGISPGAPFSVYGTVTFRY